MSKTKPIFNFREKSPSDLVITPNNQARSTYRFFKDMGIGVKSEEKEHLFKDKFFRGERADKVNIAGSGLGLYIVKNIIDGHNGTIEIKSAGPDHGTEFIVSLPVAK